MIFQSKIEKNNKTIIPKQILDQLTNKKTLIWDLNKNGEIKLLIDDESMPQECEELAKELNEIRQEMRDGKQQDSDSLEKELGL
ncbi:hypothetical protein [Methanobrevibacter filiformis]|uniref:Uncharacterized protein n=1 Tax=Methanobrevibacter filiformis TaxID=55758 RepID=A0A166EL86_9EURY|nr:hypothetical protein [Methanobrevibacter filiformis]KZX16780.1 hypothetical protein MBFIL_04710 [Methanobrevibacter filiformis]